MSESTAKPFSFESFGCGEIENCYECKHRILAVLNWDGHGQTTCHESLKYEGKYKENK